MKKQKQLDMWAQGWSIHNMETDTCVPDFSCCVPELQDTIENRRAYFQAVQLGQRDVIDTMLIDYLEKFLKSQLGDSFYLACNVRKCDN